MIQQLVIFSILGAIGNPKPEPFQFQSYVYQNLVTLSLRLWAILTTLNSPCKKTLTLSQSNVPMICFTPRTYVSAFAQQNPRVSTTNGDVDIRVRDGKDVMFTFGSEQISARDLNASLASAQEQINSLAANSTTNDESLNQRLSELAMTSANQFITLNASMKRDITGLHQTLSDLVDTHIDALEAKVSCLTNGLRWNGTSCSAIAPVVGTVLSCSTSNEGQIRYSKVSAHISIAIDISNPE